MAYLHYRIQTPKPMATLHYTEVFTLHGVRFKFQSQMQTTGMGSESESVPQSVSRNVNAPNDEFLGMEVKDPLAYLDPSSYSMF